MNSAAKKSCPYLGGFFSAGQEKGIAIGKRD
jgi:hypothetical protein